MIIYCNTCGVGSVVTSRNNKVPKDMIKKKFVMHLNLDYCTLWMIPAPIIIRCRGLIITFYMCAWI